MVPNALTNVNEFNPVVNYYWKYFENAIGFILCLFLNYFVDFLCHGGAYQTLSEIWTMKLNYNYKHL